MSEKHDAESIGEILNVVSDKVPKLVSGIFTSMYSSETGTNMGKAVGGMYKELVEAGIPQEEAIKMARDYLNSISSVINNVTSNTEKSKGVKVASVVVDTDNDE